MAALLIPLAAHGGTVVNVNDAGAGSLRQAIAQAVPGETIDFAIPGSPPHVIVLTSGTLVIDKALRIEGPGPAALEISGNDATRVFHITSENEAFLSGMTIRNGSVVDGGGCIAIGTGEPELPGATLVLENSIVRSCHSDASGGALSNGFSSTAVLRNTLFTTNDTDVDGAAILNLGELAIIFSEVRNNTAGRHGGAVFNTGDFTSSAVRMVENVASTGDAGAVFNFGGTTLIENTDVSGNDAGANGGALTNAGDPCSVNVQMVLFVSRVHDNDATGDSAFGGGIYNQGGCFLGVFDSMVTGNESTLNGGGIFTGIGSLVRIVETTISGNVAASQAGGIFVWDDATVTITSTTVSGNSGAESGGGVVVTDGSTVYLNNATISGNTSPAVAGIRDDPGSLVELRNTVVAGNTGSLDASVGDCAGAGITSHGYNLVGSGTGCPSDGVGDQAVAPAAVASIVLAPLATAGFVVATHAPLLGSPLVDRGDPAGCRDQSNSSITFDQRGVSRAIDGDLDGISRCDIGAHEGAAPVQLLGDVDGNGQVGALTDGLLMLRFAFGFSGSALVNGAVAGNCRRCTAAEIVAYLRLLSSTTS
jgi:hypothetical protein